MWIYHPFKPGAVPHRCFHDLGGVSCGRSEDHPVHQPPAETTPERVASFDQTLADLGANLDSLVTMYGCELASGQRPGISTAGLSEWLVQASGLDRVGMAEHLAAAVRRLHEADAATTPTETATPAEVRTGISDRVAAALTDVVELRRALIAPGRLSDWERLLLDRVETYILHADGGA